MPSRSRAARLRLTLGASATVLVLLVGCGSGDSSSEGAPDTKVEATSTTEAAPSTTTEPPVADAETKALAASAAYRAEDLGEGWTEAVAATDYATEGLGADDCFVPEGSELAGLALGAVAGGPTFRSPDGSVFVGSWAAAFPDEDAASRWVEATVDPSYEECQRGIIEKNATDPEAEVRTATTDEDRAAIGSNGTVRVASFQFVTDENVTSTYSSYTYQYGRVLLHVVIEVGAGDQASLDSALAAEAAARGAVVARVQPG